MDRIKKVVAEVLQIPVDTITKATAPSNVPSWDSFNGLMLVSELEREFSVSFSIEEITGVHCVGDIEKALVARGVMHHDT